MQKYNNIQIMYKYIGHENKDIFLKGINNVQVWVNQNMNIKIVLLPREMFFINKLSFRLFLQWNKQHRDPLQDSMGYKACNQGKIFDLGNESKHGLYGHL